MAGGDGEVKYTPGPWKHAHRYIIEDSEGNWIATTPAGVTAKEDALRVADAQLISAAPDLLEACEGLLRLYAKGGCVKTEAKAINRAEVAIAKAKGAE